MTKPGSQLWIGIPDSHGPYHDEVAFEVAMDVVGQERPYGVFFYGDLIECEAFSTHPRKSVAQPVIDDFMSQELDWGADVLARVRRVSKRVVFVEGNHENRVERWACASPANRAAFSAVNPREYWRGLVDEWVPYAEPSPGAFKLCPTLWVVHGWSHAKNAAGVHLDYASSFSITYGHTHRRQEATKVDQATGRTIFAFSPGCLSQRRPFWKGSQPSAFTHGFSMVYLSKSGSWTHYIVNVEDGRAILPSGRSVR